VCGSVHRGLGEGRDTEWCVDNDYVEVVLYGGQHPFQGQAGGCPAGERVSGPGCFLVTRDDVETGPACVLDVGLALVNDVVDVGCTPEAQG
jgi:hypothetical protein